MNNTLDELKTRVQEVRDLLAQHTDHWESRFNKFARHIQILQYHNKRVKRHFRIKSETGLYIYSGIRSIVESAERIKKEAKPVYQKCFLRYAGQIVADVKIQNEKRDGKMVKIAYLSTRGREINNQKCFDISVTIPEWSEWQSKEASMFRRKFKYCKKRMGHSPEHTVECEKLNEFSKSTRKKLYNIQPIKLDGYYCQMATPIAASTDEIKYVSDRNAGIDIMARITRKNNESGLVVFELKDENKKNESPSRVIKQAVSYAAFIGELLYSNSGDMWWELFGFKSRKPEHITIIASTLMPISDNPELNYFGCEGKKIEVSPNVDIELHSLFYDKENGDFVGSLRDIMME